VHMRISGKLERYSNCCFCGVLQCVAVCCSIFWCVAVCMCIRKQYKEAIGVCMCMGLYACVRVGEGEREKMCVRVWPCANIGAVVFLSACIRACVRACACE